MTLRFYTDYRLGGVPRYYVSDEEDKMFIPDEVRKCVVFLQYVDKQQQLKLAGTGFFVSIKPDGYDRNFVYLITAKHVIVAVRQKSIDGEVIIRINDVNGGHQTISAEEKLWKEHPTESDSVDVSVLAWAPSRDTFDFRTTPAFIFATEEVMNDNSIGLGDEVFITGLFASHYGKKRNIPIVRVGNIASMPEEKVETRAYGNIEAYLIEARSIGGLSGSPVFVHLGYIRSVRGETVLLQGNPQFFLLGLIHGHWDIKNDEPDGLVEDLDGGKVNMGIAMVVPAKKILEVLNQPLFEERRQEKMKQDKEKSLPVEDSPSDDETQKDKEGITKEQFEDALRKIARPLKPDDPKKKGT